MRRIGLDLFSQLSDEHAQVFVMCEHLARVAHEIREQIEFLWREMNLFAGKRDYMSFEIDVELSGFQRARLLIRSRLTPKCSANPRHQFIHAEWLRNVIVSARIERFDFRLLFSAH